MRAYRSVPSGVQMASRSSVPSNAVDTTDTGVNVASPLALGTSLGSLYTLAVPSWEMTRSIAVPSASAQVTKRCAGASSVSIAPA